MARWPPGAPGLSRSSLYECKKVYEFEKVYEWQNV